MELHLAGEGPQQSAIETLVAELGIQRCVIFRGPMRLGEIAALYANCDAFVSMSWAETFPAGILEAMSTGLPAISAANVGAREIIEDGKTGTLIPLGDFEALAEAICAYHANPAWRIQLGANAAQAVRNTYDWGAVGSRYRELYESLLGDRR